MRYSVGGSGRTASTISHVVKDDTKRTLCGRDASAWCSVVWHRPDCLKCRAMLSERQKGGA
jgi:hypothetical protein